MAKVQIKYYRKDYPSRFRNMLIGEHFIDLETDCLMRKTEDTKAMYIGQDNEGLDLFQCDLVEFGRSDPVMSIMLVDGFEFVGVEAVKQ